jgi:DNA-binding response OmpR family regulator
MSKKFLLIDDDFDDSELFLEALSKADPGSSCERFSQGRTALSKLAAGELDPPDMIFLDINLPVMSGWEILVELKKMDRLKQIPVIMYSTSSNQRDRDIAKDLGALCFFTKPNNYKILVKMMEIVVVNMKSNSIAKICSAVKEMQH